MRILLLAHAFNSLTQRIWLELEDAGHELSLEYDINDAKTRQAVAMFRPDLILAPFLKRPVPQDVWSATRTLIVHPGPPGDRGPSALDHAVQQGRETWGVTVLEARAEMDAGPVWAHQPFAMRPAPKSSLYRREVTEAAVTAVRMALARIAAGLWPLLPDNTGRDGEGEKPVLTQKARALDWSSMTRADILVRIRAADGQPGLREVMGGAELWLHDAHPAATVPKGQPGEIVGQANEAILRKTVDGGVWIGHVSIRRADGRRLKLPARRALEALGLPEPPPLAGADAPNGVKVERRGDLAVIRFDVLNGAMSARRARAVTRAIRAAQDARVILLTGGTEFWCNGIDLATIEAADSPAEESLAAIEAMDDLCLALLEAPGWTVAAMAGNAGAGGVFMALAADHVVAREGTVLNPHYKNMGNLYGSEYWTYTLPRRLGARGAAALMETRMPILARQAATLGLVDEVRTGDPEQFLAEAVMRAEALAASHDLEEMIAGKTARRGADEAERPLAAYRASELARMRLNFFGFDTSYHVARLNFITAVPKSRTPLHLARHRSQDRIAAE